jgi:hypothetical protein
MMVRKFLLVPYNPQYQNTENTFGDINGKLYNINSNTVGDGLEDINSDWSDTALNDCEKVSELIKSDREKEQPALKKFKSGKNGKVKKTKNVSTETVKTADVAPVKTADAAAVKTADAAPVKTADAAPVKSADAAPVKSADVAPMKSADVAPGGNADGASNREESMEIDGEEEEDMEIDDTEELGHSKKKEKKSERRSNRARKQNVLLSGKYWIRP